MNTAILMVTYNRLNYTQMAIQSLLQDENDNFDLYLWDNASTDGTRDYLKSLHDNRIKEIILNRDNAGQATAMNFVWNKTKAELIGKVDNDCLMSPGWIRIISSAHNNVKQLGAIGCWHFFRDDFNYENAKHKIHQFGEHKIFRHPWIGGTGFLMKRSIFCEIGPLALGVDSGTTTYFMKIAEAGYVNGWYYPLIYQEHMDDPLSQYSNLTDDNAVRASMQGTYTLRNRKIETLEARMQWRKQVLNNLLNEPWDVKQYTGWRGKMRKIKKRLQRF